MPHGKLSMIFSPDFYLKSSEEMTGLFIQTPQAIENTVKIAEMCNLEIPLGRWIMPQFDVPEGKTAEEYLEELCWAGIEKRYGKNPEQKVTDRLKYELSKVRVNVTAKIDEFMMTNRLKKGMLPELVKSMVTEITKYKMTLESEFHQNHEVKNSIPSFDESVVSIEVIRKEIGDDRLEEEYFEMDDILDKIAQFGLNSLTKSEKEFLDKKSKEL